MSPARLAYLNICRHRFATAISVIAIGLSVACGGMLLRLYKLNESRFSSLARAGDAVVGAKAGGIELLLGSLNAEGPYPGFLPSALFNSLRAQVPVNFEDGATAKASYIKSIIPILYFARYKTFRVLGTDDAFLHRPPPDAQLIRLHSGAWFKAYGEILLGAEVAHSTGLKVGDTLQVSDWLVDEQPRGETQFRVSGILAPTHSSWDRTLYTSVEQAQRILSLYSYSLAARSIWGVAVLNYFLVYLQPGGYAELAALINQRTVGQVIAVEEETNRLRAISGVGSRVGILIVLFVLALGGLAVGSLLVARFDGMTGQLAILRAIGYTRSEVFAWLVSEGLILGIVGVCLGALLDLCGLPLLRLILGATLPPPNLVCVPIWHSYPVWLVAVAGTLIATILPVTRTSRQDVHDLLRG